MIKCQVNVYEVITKCFFYKWDTCQLSEITATLCNLVWND